MAERQDAPGELAFTVTLSRVPAFVRTAGALTARAGEQAGCSADEARRLAEAVGRVLDDAIGNGSANGRPDEFELAFLANGRVLRVVVSCEDGARAAGFSLESSVAASDAQGALGGLVDRVEFGTDGARQYCRLTRQIRASR